MPPLDWEFIYNGLTFGGATAFGLIRIEGLPALPPVKASVIPKVGAHGGYVFAEFYAPRVVTIEGDIFGTDSSDLVAKVETWRNTFVVQAADQNLDYKLPGQAIRRIKCRVTRSFLPENVDFSLGYAEWIVEFMAQDTAIYNDLDVKQFDG